MLISPPFLPPRDDLTERAWLELAMASASDGAFPVSNDFGWHGGRHLVAPLDAAGVGMPVRAVADGTVVYVRQRTEASEPDAPLNYGAGYTSDAVVVIRHTTDIGLNAQGRPVSVTFYSVYMHLHAIRTGLAPNRQIYRKDEVGQAGHLYGEPNRIHFEICCDHTNLPLLVGRANGALRTDADGRAGVIFGEVYFALPAGTPVYAQEPLPTRAQATIQPPSPGHGAPRPPPQPLPAAATTNESLFVGLKWARSGPATQRGDALVSTYRADGSQVGDERRDPQAEYRLHATAVRISEAHPASGRPTPAAVYELLRFGRVIGQDALTPADVPHWRRISHSEGTGWVNLNAQDVRKFSDADFPPWREWVLVDDDASLDSHCDSATIADIVYGQGPTRAARNRREATARLGDAAIARRLSRAICKFPSEWDASTIDVRWKWLMAASDEHPEPLSESDFGKFKSHVEALCFDLPELFTAKWCFEPRQFVETFRSCGWLSAQEFAQCFPRRYLHLQGTTFHASNVPWTSALPTATTWATPFNVANRRYGVSRTAQRLVHYFSHVIPETGFLRLMKEGDNAAGTYLSGKSYWPYYGRGLIQLTWLSNYQAYGTFRDFPHDVTSGTYAALGWDPDARIARTNSNYDATNCADSACFYIAKTAGMLAKMDAGLAQADAVAVSRSVNGDVAIQNLNGLDVRLQAVLFLRDVLLDGAASETSESMTFAWRRNSQQEPTGELDSQGHPKKKYFLRVPQWTIDVPLDKQRP